MKSVMNSLVKSGLAFQRDWKSKSNGQREHSHPISKGIGKARSGVPQFLRTGNGVSIK